MDFWSLVVHLEPQIYVDHEQCQRNDGVQGAFSIFLDAYQRDELQKNRYTFAQESCLYCYQPQAFLLRVL